MLTKGHIVAYWRCIGSLHLPAGGEEEGKDWGGGGSLGQQPAHTLFAVALPDLLLSRFCTTFYYCTDFFNFSSYDTVIQ